VVESVEEAVLNSLLRATTVRGREGHETEALPIDGLRDAFARYARELQHGNVASSQQN